jgi:hypothetical protein
MPTEQEAPHLSKVSRGHRSQRLQVNGQLLAQNVHHGAQIWQRSSHVAAVHVDGKVQQGLHELR